MPREVPRHVDTVVPQRPHPTPENGPDTPPTILHFALVVPDLKLYGILRKSAWVIKPPDWAGDVKLHVLQQRPKVEPEELVNKFALTALGLVSPQVATLQYPEEIELGWKDDPAQ